MTTPLIERYIREVSALLGYPAHRHTARALMFLGYSVEAAAEKIRKRLAK